MTANDSDTTLDAVAADPSNARRHDARTLALVSGALSDVVVRHWEDPTDKPAERTPGAVIGE